MGDLYKKYNARQNAILKPASAKKFDRILIVWYLTGLTIGYITLYLNLSLVDLMHLELLELLVYYIPSLSKLPESSIYTESMRIVHLFYIVSTPIIIRLFFIKLTEFNKRKSTPFSIFFNLSICLIGIYLMVFGMDIANENTKDGFTGLYYNFLFFSVAVSESFCLMFAAPIFFLWNDFFNAKGKNL